jgi:hypothetical protein
MDLSDKRAIIPVNKWLGVPPHLKVWDVHVTWFRRRSEHFGEASESKVVSCKMRFIHGFCAAIS